MPKVSAVIPTLNEVSTIKMVLDSLPKDIVSEVLVVDGHSTDGTIELVKSLGYPVYFEEGNGFGAAFATGATGWTTGIANTIPQSCVRIFDEAVVRRNFDEARKIFAAVLPLCDFYAEKSLARSVKAAAELLDKPLGPPRLPLKRLAPADYQILRELLIRAGVVEARHALRKA